MHQTVLWIYGAAAVLGLAWFSLPTDLNAQDASPPDFSGVYYTYNPGGRGGPGPAPADLACGPLDVDKPATRERRVKVPFPKL